MQEEFVQTLLLTFKLAFLTTLLLLVMAVPVAYWLSLSRSRLKPLYEAVFSMPLVLPPTVLGFYLLLLFSPEGILGSFLEERLGIKAVFSFEGLVIASVIYSFPFMSQPVQSAFESLPKSLREASYTLGKGRVETFFKVLLPNIKPSLLRGTILAFAHTVGEFGVVLMIGGNIPGETRVASIAIYDEVEALNYDMANKYALVLVVVAFLVLAALFALERKRR